MRPKPGSPGAGAWAGLAMLALVLMLSWLSAPAASLADGLQGQRGMQALDPRLDKDQGEPAVDQEQALRSNRPRWDAAAAPAQPPAARTPISPVNPLQAQACLELSGAKGLPGMPPLLRDPGLRGPRAQAPPLA